MVLCRFCRSVRIHNFQFPFKAGAVFNHDSRRPDIPHQPSGRPDKGLPGAFHVARNRAVNIHFARARVGDSLAVRAYCQFAVFHHQSAVDLAIEEQILLAVNAALNHHSCSDDRGAAIFGTLLGNF